jgi:hypothetical protein
MTGARPTQNKVFSPSWAQGTGWMTPLLWAVFPVIQNNKGRAMVGRGKVSFEKVEGLFLVRK